MAEKARFIARYGNFSVGVQSYVGEHLGHQGEMVPVKRRIDANFQRNLVTDDDFAVALQSFAFPGQPFDEETNANVSPRHRVSVWDSEWAQVNEGWTDSEIAMIIAKLRSASGNGTNFVELTIPAADVPFPSYDDLSVDEALQIIKLTGIDPAKVAAYERENQNREALLKRLDGVEADDDAVVVQA